MFFFSTILHGTERYIILLLLLCIILNMNELYFSLFLPFLEIKRDQSFLFRDNTENGIFFILPRFLLFFLKMATSLPRSRVHLITGITAHKCPTCSSIALFISVAFRLTAAHLNHRRRVEQWFKCRRQTIASDLRSPILKRSLFIYRIYITSPALKKTPATKILYRIHFVHERMSSFYINRDARIFNDNLSNQNWFVTCRIVVSLPKLLRKREFDNTCETYVSLFTRLFIIHS